MKIFFGCKKSFYLEGRGNLPIGIGTCANFAKGSFTALLLETAVTASGHSNVYVCGLGLQHTAACVVSRDMCPSQATHMTPSPIIAIGSILHCIIILL